MSASKIFQQKGNLAFSWNASDFTVKFIKFSKNIFLWPQVEDEEIIQHILKHCYIFLNVKLKVSVFSSSTHLPHFTLHEDHKSGKQPCIGSHN